MACSWKKCNATNIFKKIGLRIFLAEISRKFFSIFFDGFLRF